MLPDSAPPLFCLDGTLYPVEPAFDWSADIDVLADILYFTYGAVRSHVLAIADPDPDWFACVCEDRVLHLDQLIAGQLRMGLVLEGLAKRATAKVRRDIWRRVPVAAPFYRMVQALVLAILGFELLDFLPDILDAVA